MQEFTLQIHITGKCNCRCKHCYISEHSSELSLSTINRILDQYKELILWLENHAQEPFRPLVNLTGGEPFLYSDLDGLFSLIEQRKEEFVFRIATNGTLFNEKILKKLKSLHLPFIQVSLDGDEKIHDSIRGKGNFTQVLRALDLLSDYGINSRVSFTAHRDNYQSFEKVAEICRQHHVKTLWSDRYVLCEANSCIFPMSKSETKEYVSILNKEKKNPDNFVEGLSIQNYRSLQFLASGEYPYHCTAGKYSIAIDENGDVFPCRRMFIKCGNIYEQHIRDLYLHYPLFESLRETKYPDECQNCPHVSFCNGGSRCQSYAFYQDFNRKDPGCWL